MSKQITKFCLLLLLSTWIFVENIQAAKIPTVGIETQLIKEISGSKLKGKKIVITDKLYLYIYNSEKTTNGYKYDLRYIGQESGEYNLKNYLVRCNGNTKEPIPDIPVIINKLLPEEYDGELVYTPLPKITNLGGYKILITSCWCIWALLLIPIIFIARPRKSEEEKINIEPKKTLAELLHPLVSKATTSKLTTAEQAKLERLLLTYWRKVLNIEELPMHEAIAVLRKDPKGGILLREIEKWLHQRPSKNKIDVKKLLAPYKNIQVPTQITEDK